MLRCPGTYTLHFAAEPGGVGCLALPDQTATAVANQDPATFDDLNQEEGTCMPTNDTSTCTYANKCTSTIGGMTLEGMFSFTFQGRSGTGKETVKSTDASGKVLLNCTYDITFAKKN